MTTTRSRALLGLASLGSLLLAVASVALAQPRPAPALTRVQLSIALVSARGAPIVSDSWLEERLAAANRIYAPCGIDFVIGETRELDAAHANLVTRADRHALGRELHTGAANVFVVSSLRDVDAEGFRQGVHWRPAGRPGAHFVIISAESGPSTLAHELGHFFGNGHSATRGNIMSYDRGDVEPFFDAIQRRRITQFLARFLRTRELVPLRTQD